MRQTKRHSSSPERGVNAGQGVPTLTTDGAHETVDREAACPSLSSRLDEECDVEGHSSQLTLTTQQQTPTLLPRESSGCVPPLSFPVSSPEPPAAVRNHQPSPLTVPPLSNPPGGLRMAFPLHFTGASPIVTASSSAPSSPHARTPLTNGAATAQRRGLAPHSHRADHGPQLPSPTADGNANRWSAEQARIRTLEAEVRLLTRQVRRLQGRAGDPMVGSRDGRGGGQRKSSSPTFTAVSRSEASSSREERVPLTTRQHTSTGGDGGALGGKRERWVHRSAEKAPSIGEQNETTIPTIELQPDRPLTASTHSSTLVCLPVNYLDPDCAPYVVSLASHKGRMLIACSIVEHRYVCFIAPPNPTGSYAVALLCTRDGALQRYTKAVWIEYSPLDQPHTLTSHAVNQLLSEVPHATTRYTASTATTTIGPPEDHGEMNELHSESATFEDDTNTICDTETVSDFGLRSTADSTADPPLPLTKALLESIPQNLACGVLHRRLPAVGEGSPSSSLVAQRHFIDCDQDHADPHHLHLATSPLPSRHISPPLSAVLDEVSDTSSEPGSSVQPESSDALSVMGRPTRDGAGVNVSREGLVFASASSQPTPDQTFHHPRRRVVPSTEEEGESVSTHHGPPTTSEIEDVGSVAWDDPDDDDEEEAEEEDSFLSPHSRTVVSGAASVAGVDCGLRSDDRLLDVSMDAAGRGRVRSTAYVDPLDGSELARSEPAQHFPSRPEPPSVSSVAHSTAHRTLTPMTNFAEAGSSAAASVISVDCSSCNFTVISSSSRTTTTTTTYGVAGTSRQAPPAMARNAMSIRGWVRPTSGQNPAKSAMEDRVSQGEASPASPVATFLEDSVSNFSLY